MELPVYIYVLMISLITGITTYFLGPAPLYLRLFPVFLLITLLVEVLASWMQANVGRNTVLFNFYTVFEHSFFLFVIRSVISSNKVKRIIFHITWIYPLLAVINILFIQGLHSWHSISYAFGNLLLVAFSIYYFFELFKRPKSTKLITDPAFWICSGLLFFFCCSFPFLGLANFLSQMSDILIRNLRFILTFLNILLYLSFTVAFVCWIMIRKLPVK